MEITVLHQLGGCWAKINRGQHHIKFLETDIADFFQRNPHTVVGQFNRDCTEYLFTATGPVEIPVNFAVVAGEVVHHLRSSLDHLVWALVVQRGCAPKGHVQFPICSTPKKFESACKRGKIDGISNAAQAIIQDAQPFRTGQPTNHPLAILQDLNNTDKHKLLLIVSCATGVGNTLEFSGACIENHEIDIIPSNWSKQAVRTVDGGTEVLRIRFKRPIPEMKVDAQFLPHIAFDQFGGANLEPIIPSLVHLHDYVANTINLFNGEF